MLAKLFERPDGLLNQKNRQQFLATLVINIIPISHGIGLGWLSPTLRQLQSLETPLSFEVSVAEVSWIGSLLGLGSITGNILIGVLLDRIGRRYCLLLLAFPHSCLWLLAYFAESVEYLYVGRLIGGICGGGIYIVHPIFVSEIANADIRGTLASTVLLSANVGILAGYIMATHLSYYVMPWIVICLPVIYFISCFFFLPETPQHLIRQGKYVEAEKSFRYYKNIKDAYSVSARCEFEDLKLALTKNEDQPSHKLRLKDFVSRPALKAYVPALVVVIANQFSGLFTFVNYMSDIFAQSGSTMDPNTCTIIIGAVQICGTYVTTLLCDIYGRKILMLVSTGGVALSLAAFGCFTFYAQRHDLSGWSWLPLLIMSFYIFLGNIGVVGCFFVVLVEQFPAKIRTQATSISIVVCSCFVFLMLNIFPLCMAQWGISATMWTLSCITAGTFVFFLCYLKETKGKSMLED